MGVVDQRSRGVIAFDDLVLDGDASPVGTVADLGEALLQVTPRGLKGLLAIGARFGVGGAVGNRDGDQLAAVSAGDVDRDVERPEGYL
jgi:hypothetical protein